MLAALVWHLLRLPDQTQGAIPVLAVVAAVAAPPMQQNREQLQHRHRQQLQLELALASAMLHRIMKALQQHCQRQLRRRLMPWLWQRLHASHDAGTTATIMTLAPTTTTMGGQEGVPDLRACRAAEGR